MSFALFQGGSAATQTVTLANDSAGPVSFRAVADARSPWLVRLIRPAWDSCERYRPVLLAEGSLQDRHEELDVELLDACGAHEPDRAAQALHDHLQLASDIYEVELKGRSIFAF